MALVRFTGLGPLRLSVPSFGLYLHENAALGGERVGAVLAVIPLVGLVVQPFWGILADRTGLRAQVLVAVCAGSALGYAALAGAGSFAELVLATALLSAFQP